MRDEMTLSGFRCNVHAYLCTANPYVKSVHLLLERPEERDFILGEGIYDPCGKLVFFTVGKYMTYRGACFCSPQLHHLHSLL